jgi:hypothetical protein
MSQKDIKIRNEVCLETYIWVETGLVAYRPSHIKRRLL